MRIKPQTLVIRNPLFAVFVLVFFFSLKGIKAQSTIDGLLNQYSGAAHDTVRIRLLFEMGNCYLSGPSDSLIHYYQRALELINTNLENRSGATSGKSTKDVFLDFKVRALIELGIEHFFTSDYPRSLEYYFEALEIVQQSDDIELLSECYSEIGIVYKNQGKFDQALEYYAQAVHYAEQTTDTSWIASCKINIGNVYKEQGYLTVALNYYFEALSILEKLNHDRRISACYQNIGDVYRKQLDFNKALEYYSRALQLALNTDDKIRIVDCYLNIGYVYSSMEQYTVAREYYYRAYGLYRELGHSHELDDCYILIGDSHLKEDNLDSAHTYYTRALEISAAENDLYRKAEVLGKLAEIHLMRKEFSEARKNAEQGLQMADQVGALDLSIRARESLARIYEQMGDPALAFETFKDYSRLKDSLFSVEKYKALTEMEVKYESDKKEQQLALLEERTQVQMLTLSRRKRIYITSLLVVGLMGILAYILYRNQRLKSRHRSIELEQRLMRSQMNPHFIFNSLIAIQSYIYKQDAVTAGDYLAKFADLIRITLESSRSELVPLEKELKMLKAYLELQALRFENAFDYSIEVDPEIDLETCRIPPMLAQPFIENAIEHGIRHKEARGNIRIALQAIENTILCSVEDDGVGREKTRASQKGKTHQSMATSITLERLGILSRRKKQTFDLEIEDLKDESGKATGTRVTFNMPYSIAYKD